MVTIALSISQFPIEEQKEYFTIRDMALVAAEYAVHNKGQVSHSLFLDAFCILFTREIWQKFGPWVEEYQCPAKAVMDYTVNLVKAGYDCLVAKEVWLHNSFIHCVEQNIVMNRYLENTGICFKLFPWL